MSPDHNMAERTKVLERIEDLTRLREIAKFWITWPFMIGLLGWLGVGVWIAVNEAYGAIWGLPSTILGLGGTVVGAVAVMAQLLHDETPVSYDLKIREARREYERLLCEEAS